MPTDKSKTLLILIAEDDALVMRAYLRIIKPIAEAANASLWTEAENPNNFVLAAHEMREYARIMLITDGDMPYMTGPDLIRALHERLGDKLEKRVLISGTLDQSMMDEVKDLDVLSLAKPVENKRLSGLVSAFLSISAP